MVLYITILKNVIKVNNDMPKVIANRILDSTDINKKIGISSYFV